MAMGQNAFDRYYWHFDMLRDDARNEAYDAAIQSALSRAPGARCVDIGSGSGLLALLCCKHGAGQVLAVEVVGELSEVANANAEANGFGGRMEVLNKHSSEMPPLCNTADRFQVIVGELLDTGLIGEGLLPSMRHAISNLLAPGFISVPAGAKVWGQIVQGELLSQLRGVEWLEAPEVYSECPGAASPVHVHSAPLIAAGLLEPLSQPFEVFEFDFCAPPSHKGRAEQHRVLIAGSGAVGGVLVWWECGMGDGVEVMTTRPGRTAPPDHWRQALFPLAPVRGGGLAVRAGQEVAVNACHDDDDLWFSVDELERASDPHCLSAPLCVCYAHVGLRPERCWALSRDQASLAAVAFRAKEAAKKCGGQVVVLGTGPILPILLGGDVTAVSNDSNLGRWTHWLRANGVERYKPIEALQPGESVAAVIGEPFYHSLDHATVATAMQFMSEVSLLRPHFSKDTIVSPQRCRVCGVLVECEALWRVHQPVSTVSGVDMSRINCFLKGSETVRELRLWSYAPTVLSDVMQLFCLVPGSPHDDQQQRSTEVEVTTTASGTAHMLAVWCRFEHYGEGEHEAASLPPFLTPGPEVQECVMLPRTPCAKGDRFRVVASLGASGELQVKVSDRLVKDLENHGDTKRARHCL